MEAPFCYKSGRSGHNHCSIGSMCGYSFSHRNSEGVRRFERTHSCKMVQRPSGARESLVKHGGSLLEGTWISTIPNNGEAATADAVPSIRESRLFTPGLNQRNIYRTIIISGLPTAIMSSTNLDSVRESAIFSTQILDTLKITGFNTELVSLFASSVLSGSKSMQKSILPYSTVSRGDQTLVPTPIAF